MPVGADHQRADLGCEAPQRMLHQRFAIERLQALVDAAHPGAAAAGEDQAGDVLRCDGVHPPM
jgi:hypothetical protein